MRVRSGKRPLEESTTLWWVADTHQLTQEEKDCSVLRLQSALQPTAIHPGLTAFFHEEQQLSTETFTVTKRGRKASARSPGAPRSRSLEKWRSCPQLRRASTESRQLFLRHWSN